VFDGIRHLGTFCGDGAYTLPINHKLNLGSNLLTIIPYASPSVQLSFKYKIDVSEHIWGLINPSEFRSKWKEGQSSRIFSKQSMHISYHFYHTYNSRNATHIERVNGKGTVQSMTLHIQTLHVTHIHMGMRNDLRNVCCRNVNGTAHEAAHVVSLRTFSFAIGITVYSTSKFHPVHTVPLSSRHNISVYKCEACHKSYTVIDFIPRHISSIQKPVSRSSLHNFFDHMLFFLPATNAQLYIMQQHATISVKQSAF
jgi:hypothetical protein